MSPNDGETSEDSGDAAQPSMQAADSGTTPLKKKTISCTQCRRRKLKCDRVKPSCGLCSRLRHQCVYPEGRMKSTTKRRNVKDLEARLAQVESLLSSEVASKPLKTYLMAAQPDAASSINPSPFWTGPDSLNPSLSNIAIPLLPDGPFSYDLIGCGLEEQLPPQDLIDSLHTIFFNRIYPMVPMLHKYRYLAAANLPPSLGPPLCLRYAVWASAAGAVEMYKNYQDIFYRRARKYAEADEMKGQGEQILSVGHAQAWVLISCYEAENMYMSRAWVSGGRCIRMVQMMNLHRLDVDDGDEQTSKKLIPPPRDCLELEERRRTFWAAFCCDRYSCAGSGWPMAMEERDIMTNLPTSDEAFDKGETEATTSLAEAMTAEGASKISPFGGQILMACLFGHNWAHLHRPGPNDNPQDPVNGKFWRRHRSMDNVLSNLFMFLPHHLRLPGNVRDSKVVSLNMNIHTSTICLHQVAIMKAERHRLDAAVIAQSQNRCRVAADEIVNIMRLISQFDIAQMNTWMAFNLYVAAGVLIEGCNSPEIGQHSRNSLEFLFTALNALGFKRPVSRSFLTQLKIDLEVAGISSWFGKVTDEEIVHMKHPGGTIGPHSIYASRSTRSRIIEIPVEMINPSRAGSSNIQSSTNSTTTSSKESPPSLDFQNFHPMESIHPRISLNLRMRRDVNGLNSNGSAEMDFMSSMGSEAVHTGSTGSAQNMHNSTFSFQSVYDQEYLPNTTSTYNAHSASDVPHPTFKPDDIAPEFNFSSFGAEELSGFQFPPENVEDLSSLLWGDSLFNK